jgi:hypothetical protein
MKGFSLSLHRASWYESFTFTNRCTYLLALESTKIYIKIHIELLLHVSVCDHHQGARTWAWLKLKLLKMFGKIRRYGHAVCGCMLPHHCRSIKIGGWMRAKSYWNDTDRGYWSTRSKTRTSVTLCTKNTTRTGLGKKTRASAFMGLSAVSRKSPPTFP